MGEAKGRRKQFFEQHPRCCFCGGDTPAESYDEQPPRAFFIDRQWPNEFRFPACEPCNSGSRITDLATAMIGRLANPDSDAYRQRDIRRIAEGIRNNAPELMPDIYLSTRDKRRRMRSVGLPLPPGQSYAELPLVGLDEAIFEHLEKFVLKMTKALFYKELGRIVGHDAAFLQIVRTNVPDTSDKYMDQLIAAMPGYSGARWNNRDVSDQFSYRWHYSDSDTLFAFAGAFAGAFLGFGACVTDRSHIKAEHKMDWVDLNGRPIS